jgi:hypothetical protein
MITTNRQEKPKIGSVMKSVAKRRFDYQAAETARAGRDYGVAEALPGAEMAAECAGALNHFCE